MTLPQLRHEIRNQLNAIKLTSALMQRRQKDDSSQESLEDIDRAADAINELVTRFLGGADYVDPGVRQSSPAVMAE